MYVLLTNAIYIHLKPPLVFCKNGQYTEIIVLKKVKYKYVLSMLVQLYMLCAYVVGRGFNIAFVFCPFHVNEITYMFKSSNMCQHSNKWISIQALLVNCSGSLRISQETFQIWQ